MKSLRLTADGDLDLTYGRATIVTGATVVAQRLRQRLETVRGEWVYDLERGLPLYEEILQRGPMILALEAHIAELVKTTQGVGAIQTLDLAAAPDRRLAVELVVGTEQGEAVSLAAVVGG